VIKNQDYRRNIPNLGISRLTSIKVDLDGNAPEHKPERFGCHDRYR